MHEGKSRAPPLSPFPPTQHQPRVDAVLGIVFEGLEGVKGQHQGKDSVRRARLCNALMKLGTVNNVTKNACIFGLLGALCPGVQERLHCVHKRGAM